MDKRTFDEEVLQKEILDLLITFSLQRKIQFTFIYKTLQ